MMHGMRCDNEFEYILDIGTTIIRGRYFFFSLKSPLKNKKNKHRIMNHSL